MLNQGKKKKQKNEEQQKGNGKHGTRKSHKTILFCQWRFVDPSPSIHIQLPYAYALVCVCMYMCASERVFALSLQLSSGFLAPV